MKTLHLNYLIIILAITLQQERLNAQCYTGILYPSTAVDISSGNVTLVSTGLLGGLHYSVVSGLVAGNTYEFRYFEEPPDPGFDRYITLRRHPDNSQITHNDSPLTWTATVTGSIRVYGSHDVNCDVHCLPINWTIIQWRKFA